MEGVLRDLPKVVVYLDDTLITGHNETDHLQTLEQVLTRSDNESEAVKVPLYGTIS